MLRMKRQSVSKGLALSSVLLFLLSLSACSVINGLLDESDKNIDSNYMEQMVPIPKGFFVESKSGKENVIGLDAFYISRYEVTQKEWKAIMGKNPSRFKGDALPVEMVTWYSALEYCNLLSEKEGLSPYYEIIKSNRDPHNTNHHSQETSWYVAINEGSKGYRLPTEAEWVYAARGGVTESDYIYSGSNLIDEVAWFYGNSGSSASELSTHEVGSKKPNQLKLYDMSGNVAEWVWDWVGSESYDTKSSNNPHGPLFGEYKTVCGGGWNGDKEMGQINSQDSAVATWAYSYYGFRVARSQ